MIYTDLTKKCMQIAYDAHFGQVDRGNTPYICHPLHVADQMTTETRTATALLHDVIEDTEETAQSLIRQGIPEGIVNNVLLLTRNINEDYASYIERIAVSGNMDVILVKFADLCHNLDMTRTSDHTLPDYLLNRYIAAKKRLLEVIPQEEEKTVG